ncbi:MAG: hypothetical protein WA700_08015 [Acidobacteriaceae bacterium]
MNSTFAMILFVALFWPFGSSSKKFQMQANNIVPAANGTVTVKRDKNDRDSKVDVKVNNLAAPSSLAPSESVYIVWVKPNGDPPEKKGAIGLGNNLNGQLNVVTTARDFEVFITGEPGESVTQPSGPEVLKAHVNLG